MAESCSIPSQSKNGIAGCLCCSMGGADHVQDRFTVLNSMLSASHVKFRKPHPAQPQLGGFQAHRLQSQCEPLGSPQKCRSNTLGSCRIKTVSEASLPVPQRSGAKMFTVCCIRRCFGMTCPSNRCPSYLQCGLCHQARQRCDRWWKLC